MKLSAILSHRLASRTGLRLGLALWLGALGASLAAAPLSAETHELRIAHFVAPTHPIHKFFEKWGAELETASEGRLKFVIYPSAQLGPAARYFDLTRRGQVDVAWVLHGALPNRFPLVELSNLPFLFCSGEQASKVLNDPELRARYLDQEHEGVKVLNIHAHVPGHLWTADTMVSNVADMKGLAIRPASRTIGAFVAALGASPVGLAPNELAEAMEKGTADGGFMDYPAGAFSFRLGAVTDHIAEMSAYTTSFSIVMNQEAFDGLPADLQAMIETSMQGREAEIGGGWDNLVEAAKADLIAAGVEIAPLEAADLAQFKAIGDQVTQTWLADLDKTGKPASEVFAMMRTLADRHAAGSADFCR
jgi:TRAP-type C4-dicarboxylate transport system substrate-binding protein